MFTSPAWTFTLNSILLYITTHSMSMPSGYLRFNLLTLYPTFLTKPSSLLPSLIWKLALLFTCGPYLESYQIFLKDHSVKPVSVFKNVIIDWLYEIIFLEEKIPCNQAYMLCLFSVYKFSYATNCRKSETLTIFHTSAIQICGKDETATCDIIWLWVQLCAPQKLCWT